MLNLFITSTTILFKKQFNSFFYFYLKKSHNSTGKSTFFSPKFSIKCTYCLIEYINTNKNNTLFTLKNSLFKYYNNSIELLFSAILLFWQRHKSAGRNILITGLSDSGKTTIYSHLIHSKIVETYTSVADNIGEIRIQNVCIFSSYNFFLSWFTCSYQSV